LAEARANSACRKADRRSAGRSFSKWRRAACSARSRFLDGQEVRKALSRHRVNP
jgi:hypothetical protein